MATKWQPTPLRLRDLFQRRTFHLDDRAATLAQCRAARRRPPPRGAYDALGRAGPGPGIALAHCWADARRQFIEAGRIIRSRAGRCSTSSASSTPSSG